MKRKVNRNIKTNKFTILPSKNKKINLDSEKKSYNPSIKKSKINFTAAKVEPISQIVSHNPDKIVIDQIKKNQEEEFSTNEFPSLQLKDNFDWNVKLEQFCEKTTAGEESEEEYEDPTSREKKKLTHSEKLASAKEAEYRLRKIESDLLQGEQNPQSADQFDRVLLAHPENAALWIKYMSFYLQATEIDKARAIAKRALQTINHQNEGERFNVWVALLNLEHTYGTEESLKDTFNEALKTNDEYLVYAKMLEIYASANKNYDTEIIAKTMIRKFRCSYDSWLLICKVLMRYKMYEKARVFFLKAAQNLTRKEHVNLTSQFAKLENENGFAEEANTLYENILTSFPDRIDVWIVYIDMLTKDSKIEQAREVMERAVKQSLPVKKMKSLYSKWLSFEEKFGNEDAIERVKQAAVQYINKVTSSLPT